MSISKTVPVPGVDLHCHILPNWDDGPSSLEKSLEIAQKAVAAGIGRIVATPHVGRSFGSRPEPPSQEIAGAVQRLQAEIDRAGIALELIPGAELMLSPIGLAQRVGDEPWLAFGQQQRYVLVESPFHFWPEWADQVLFELALQGLTPIIAHPERLADVQKDVDVMRPLVERGVLLQVTARSLVSPQREIRECSRRLLEAGLVAVIASDAHSARHPQAVEVQEQVTALVGEPAAQQILVTNPHAVLEGERVELPVLPALQKSARGGFLSRWLGVI